MGSQNPELVLKCTDGLFKGKFLYVNTTVSCKQEQGEVFGSGSPYENELTISIERAELEPRHAQIFHNEGFFLRNLSSQGDTWIKIQETLEPGERLIPGYTLRVGPLEFVVREGKKESLQNNWIQNYSLQHLSHLLGSKSLNWLFNAEVEELECEESDKRRIKKAIEEMKLLPREIRKIRIVSEDIEFSVGWKPVLIGSSSKCDIWVPGVSEVQCKVFYDQDSFFILNLDEGKVYRKLLENENFKLVVGRSFKIGKIEFEVCSFNLGKWSETGLRPSMEDSDKVIQNLFISEEPVFYCGIFDGHGGKLCSEFLKSQLHLYLKARLRNQPFENWSKLIKEAFRQCDQDFKAKEPERSREMGSTALVVLIQNNRMLVCNVGDSRALLCRSGVTLRLTRDHRPNDPKEASRIHQNGGIILFGRVYGKLAVSRAFGDFELKDFQVENRCEHYQPVLSVEPEIREFELDWERDEFLVMACDGLFEAFSDEEVVSNARNKLRRMPPTEQDPSRVIKEIVSEAVYSRQTSDNVSAFLISLCAGVS